MTFFSCRLLATPTFRRRLSSVLSKNVTATQIIFSRVSPLDGVTRAVRPLPSDAAGDMTLTDHTSSPLTYCSQPLDAVAMLFFAQPMEPFILCIRSNPPAVLHNQTKLDIFFRQQIKPNSFFLGLLSIVQFRNVLAT